MLQVCGNEDLWQSPDGEHWPIEHSVGQLIHQQRLKAFFVIIEVTEVRVKQKAGSIVAGEIIFFSL